GGSYHWLADTVDGERLFLTIDDLDRKPWLGIDRTSVLTGLETTFDTALALRAAHCGFVVAPIRSRTGASLHRLSSQYSLAVFPYLDGRAGEFSETLNMTERTQLLQHLAQLHQTTSVVAGNAARRGPELSGRFDLETAMRDVDQPWRGGPYAELA